MRATPVNIVILSLAFALLLQGQEGRERDRFGIPATGQNVAGQIMLLAVDDESWPLRSGLTLFLSKPSVRKEPVLTPSRDNLNSPDYLATSFYGTVLFDEGKFRMWYYACLLYTSRCV